MPSPFPGMDPYIEGCGLWETFHAALALKIYEQLAEAAPDRYHVRPAERNYIALIESEETADRAFLPDVSVTASRSRKKSPSRPAGRSGTATADPEEDDGAVTMRAFIEEEHREVFVEIYENTPDHRLVTAIEVLSLSNKRSGTTGRDLYLRKRQNLFLDRINLVEVDLLRSGEKMPMLDKYPACPHTLLVARARKPDLRRVWPAHFSKPLPSIPVPLLKGDPDLTLSLQPLIESVYRLSRYDHDIDYTKPLSPPLPAEDEAWLKERVRAGRS